MKTIDGILSQIKTDYWKVLYFLIAIIVAAIESSNRNDWYIYQLASLDVVQHINPYSHSYIDGYYYYYSLLFAYLVYPFTFLSTYWSSFVWLMLNAFFLYYIIIKISEFIGISRHSQRTQFLFYLLLIVFNARTIRENFHSAQVTILILFLFVVSLDSLFKKKFWLSALTLALAINIKLLGVAVLAYYLYKGQWRVVMYSIIFTLLFFVLPALWLPIHFYEDCMHKWWMLINPNNDHHLIDVEERSFHSITTLITTLFMKNPPDVYALPVRRYILDLQPDVVKYIIQISRLILLSSVLIVIKKLPFQNKDFTDNPFKVFYEFAYISALIPLIFPHQQHYAFLLQMPALAILIKYFLIQKSNALFYVSMILIFLCFNLKILLGAFNDYYDHFKILTYGGLLTLVLLIYFSFKLNENR